MTKKSKIEWADFKFPPINLWVLPSAYWWFTDKKGFESKLKQQEKENINETVSGSNSENY